MRRQTPNSRYWSPSVGRLAIDLSSSSASRYSQDETHGDLLAADARAALRACLSSRDDVLYPDGSRVGRAFWGVNPDAPDLVWHAQAVGVLLEFGFEPRSAAVQAHVRVMLRRLQEDNAPNPQESRSPWVLRTRHVAWVLACLAEHPGDVGRRSSDGDAQGEGEFLAALELAYRYIEGDRTAGEPARWIGPLDGAWTECWGARKHNLLNTLYACLGIVRANHHGIAPASRNELAIRGFVRAAGSHVRAFMNDLRIELTKDGPRCRLGGERRWLAPWTREIPLPASVVGLIALVSREYGHFLLSHGSPEMAERALTLTQRLAHELCSRADEWSGRVDAFRADGADRGWWTIPSYSIALRAILDASVVSPLHPTVRAAVDVIQTLAREGDGFETWADPVYSRLDQLIDDPNPPSWHTSIRFADDLGEDTLSRMRPTPASIHAAVMALASLRRALGAADPRHVRASMERRPAKLPPNTFHHIELGPRTARLHGPGGYVETLQTRYSWNVLLRVLGSTSPADASALAGRVRVVSAEVPDVRAPRSAEGVRGAVDAINRTVGVALVERGEDGTYRLTCRMDLAD